MSEETVISIDSDSEEEYDNLAVDLDLDCVDETPEEVEPECIDETPPDIEVDCKEELVETTAKIHTHGELLRLVDSYAGSAKVTNGYALKYFFDNDKKYAITSTNLALKLKRDDCNVLTVTVALKRLFNCFKGLSLNRDRHWQAITELLSQDFILPKPRSSDSIKDILSLGGFTKSKAEQNNDTCTSSSSPSLRLDCSGCAVKRISNQALLEKLKQMRLEKKELQAQLQLKKNEPDYNDPALRKLIKTIEKKNSSIENLKKDKLVLKAQIRDLRKKPSRNKEKDLRKTPPHNKEQVQIQFGDRDLNGQVLELEKIVAEHTVTIESQRQIIAKLMKIIDQHQIPLTDFDLCNQTEQE